MRAAHHGIGRNQPVKQPAIPFECRVPRFADEPDVDHLPPGPAAGLRDLAAVFDDVLFAGMGGGSAVGKGAAIHDDVVLHVLNDHRGLCGVDGKGRHRSCRGRSGGAAHEGFQPRPCLHVHRIDRRRRTDKKRAPILPAPVKVGGFLGNRDFAKLHAVEVVDPDAAGPGHVDVSFGVAFHAIRHTFAVGLNDPAGKKACLGQLAVARDIEHADIGLLRIVHPDELLAGAETQAIGLGEHVAVRHQLRLVSGPMAGWQSIDALKAHFRFALDTKTRHPPIGWVGEVDRPVRADDDVVRRVQLAAFEMAGQNLTRSIGANADNG